RNLRFTFRLRPAASKKGQAECIHIWGCRCCPPPQHRRILATLEVRLKVKTGRGTVPHGPAFADPLRPDCPAKNWGILSPRRSLRGGDSPRWSVGWLQMSCGSIPTGWTFGKPNLFKKFIVHAC